MNEDLFCIVLYLAVKQEREEAFVTLDFPE